MFYFCIALAFIENVADMIHSSAQMISMMEMPKKIPMVPPNCETRQSSWQTKYSSLAGQYYLFIILSAPSLLLLLCLYLDS